MTLEAAVRITNPTGLHARPAVKLAQLAARYQANVEVRVDDGGDWVRARSTARVMKLKAIADATLHFRAEGEQAADALDALVAFVRRDFDEGPGHGTPAPVSGPSTGPADNAAPAVRGEIASNGIARGHLHVLAPTSELARRRAGSPAQERSAFDAALDDAVADLETLAARSDSVGAEIIGFQIGLLRDTEFVAPVNGAIAAGGAAPDAWDQHLSTEIADYEGAGDDRFRERAADLRDLHERVATALAGGAGDAAALPRRAIVVADEITPSRFLELPGDRLAGLATRVGGIASHVAMLARSRQLPYLVKLDAGPGELEHGAEAVIDAERGLLVLTPDEATLNRYRGAIEKREHEAKAARRWLDRPARTTGGVTVKAYLNVDDPALLEDVDPAHCDGIGLTRTEFLFHGCETLPDEASQLDVYRRLVAWADGRPVTVRTLDAGADKPIPGLTLEAETNPFLGVRGLRLSLARPEVFRVQLRALARAAADGPLKIMLPMVTLPEELDRARAMLDEVLDRLAREGVAAARPALGIMVEVPAAALTVERFSADFFSIGSNDLVQYVMAAGRDSSNAPALHDPLQPAVMALIERVARHGANTGAEVSVCGEMAASPACIPALLAAGVRTLSVPPPALAATKSAIAACDTVAAPSEPSSAIMAGVTTRLPAPE